MAAVFGSGCAGGGGDFPIQVSAAADARSPSAVGLRAATGGVTWAGGAWPALSAAGPAVGGGATAGDGAPASGLGIGGAWAAPESGSVGGCGVFPKLVASAAAARSPWPAGLCGVAAGGGDTRAAGRSACGGGFSTSITMRPPWRQSRKAAPGTTVKSICPAPPSTDWTLRDCPCGEPTTGPPSMRTVTWSPDLTRR